MAYSFDNSQQITPINRSTTADGDALNSTITSPMFKRDAMLLSNTNVTYDIADSVSNTVKTYSADWQNSAISGFSAVSISSEYNNTLNKIYGAAAFAKQMKISARTNRLFDYIRVE